MKLRQILTLAILTVAALTLSGCTSTEVASDTFKMKRTSVFQKIGIAEASHSADGTFLLRGYQNDGGNQALANALVAMAQMMQYMQAAQGMQQTQPATVVPPSGLPRTAPLRPTTPPVVSPGFPFIAPPQPAPNSAP